MMHIEHEAMNGVFGKIHVRGAPENFIIHEFTGPDHGHPHDHNFDINVTILRGGYAEERWKRSGGGWFYDTLEHRPGDQFTIEATDVHRIIRLLDGPCMTLATYGPWVQEPGFWQFDHGGASRRQHNSDQWVRV